MREPEIETAAPGSPAGAAVLRAYMTDIVGRYQGRQATTDEVDAALRDHPPVGLAPPEGVFLLARDGDDVVGCAGMQVLPGGVGEVRRVFVEPRARGRGIGTRLLRELERHAAVRGVTRLRLDTRHDLVEARALYARLGYAEVAPFNVGPYAEHWFAKELPSGQELAGADVPSSSPRM
ncbi:GNAT family N-acetyltransferase [Pseudonocardia kunmingensis]|uniref:Acetyltransferase (GNAT) family protein n=1 Tax=Pseudonocardia kunmingensis TaxID=630975 RepID=A0A543D4D5_9PSEU|nr:GNAT family N-acetyltransferase [Pseudonocardia kunmingensis]TQM04193.1 acetyltransferase (GNAT) family protein [Pseudonocardia kunmingensis]